MLFDTETINRLHASTGPIAIEAFEILFTKLELEMKERTRNIERLIEIQGVAIESLQRSINQLEQSL